MKINTIPKCAWYTFSNSEIIFKKKNQMFPEELYRTLILLGYERNYVFSIVQKEMDEASKIYMQELEADFDRQNPFLNPSLLDNSNTLESR